MQKSLRSQERLQRLADLVSCGLEAIQLVSAQTVQGGEEGENEILRLRAPRCSAEVSGGGTLQEVQKRADLRYSLHGILRMVGCENDNVSAKVRRK